MVTLCPDEFSKSGISATIAGCKATAHRSLISAALAVFPAVVASKASPNVIVAEILNALRRFILACPQLFGRVSGMVNHQSIRTQVCAVAICDTTDSQDR